MQRGTLVARIDKLDALVLRRVHQRQDGVSHDGKHLFDALLLQAADEEVSPGQFSHGSSWIDVVQGLGAAYPTSNV